VLGEPAAELRQRAEDAIRDNAKAVVLDLSGLTYIDSAGLGVLAVAFSRCKAAGCGLRAAAPQPLVKEAIELVRLESVIPVFRSVDDALGSFAPMAA
jgi:anti-sigma B factor antagonist